MIQRLAVRDNETPDRARKRFDGEFGVRDWATPGSQMKETTPRDPNQPKTPWWWDSAEDASQPFMAMARARGMVE
ncbi:hypothetical protein OHA71_06370 [Streptomyces sp. NBC_00444]|uniref:hypothetical protein n=1 Tax=Streptomyces sp. NBC_00444 TaxID=2975744 RepID=UPI002E244A4D